MSKFSEMMENHKMSIKQISDRFGIPYRTVQNWSASENSTNYRECPDYIINLMEIAMKSCE